MHDQLKWIEDLDLNDQLKTQIRDLMKTMNETRRRALEARLGHLKRVRDAALARADADFVAACQRAEEENLEEANQIIAEMCLPMKKTRPPGTC